jgi:hypothetical protein
VERSELGRELLRFGPWELVAEVRASSGTQSKMIVRRLKPLLNNGSEDITGL